MFLGQVFLQICCHGEAHVAKPCVDDILPRSSIVDVLRTWQPKRILQYYLRSPQSPCLPLVAGFALTKMLTKSTNAYTTSLTLFRAAEVFNFSTNYRKVILSRCRCGIGAQY